MNFGEALNLGYSEKQTKIFLGSPSHIIFLAWGAVPLDNLVNIISLNVQEQTDL